MYLLYEYIFYVLFFVSVALPIIYFYKSNKEKSWSIMRGIKYLFSGLLLFAVAVAFLLASWVTKPESVIKQEAKEQAIRLEQLKEEQREANNRSAERDEKEKQQKLLKEEKKKELIEIKNKLVVTIFTNDNNIDKDGNTQVKAVIHNPTNKTIKKLNLKVTAYDYAENKMESEEFGSEGIAPNGTTIGTMWISNRKALKRFGYVLDLQEIAD